jgi:predicted nucleic acid-binding protein
MPIVLLDTVGLLALWNQNDQWHAPATAAHNVLMRSAAVPFTTTFVLLECGNAAARHSFRDDVISLRRKLEAKNLLVVPSDSDWQQAWADYERRFAGQAGIVDCVSFAVMRRLGCTDVFSNDQHFRAAGFRTLF